ncbi:MAG: antitoxin, RHH family protein [Elusimicrobiota bacterium]
MPTKHPRVNLVLERPIYQIVESLARKNDLSLSSQIRALILEALETTEDICLSIIADERSKSFDRSKSLSHNHFWKRALIPYS